MKMSSETNDLHETGDTPMTATTRAFGHGINEDEMIRMEEDRLIQQAERAEDEAVAAYKADRDARPESIGAAGPKGRLTVDQFDFKRHDGIVSILNPKTGNHRTFRIKTLRGSWRTGQRILEILDGPDNTRDYRMFAWVKSTGIEMMGNYRYPGVDGEPNDWEKFAAMIENPQRFIRWGLEYNISGHCRRCGRVLTTPRSVSLGIGPTCEGKE
jgi:hypothetical protein